MSDLISREAAIEEVAQRWLFEASSESPYVNDDDIGEYRKLARELFEDVPSAEPAPVVAYICDRPKGEWIDKEIPCEPYPPVFFVECSKCGYRVGRETFLENTFNFCPCCGADMRGAER